MKGCVPCTYHLTSLGKKIQVTLSHVFFNVKIHNPLSSSKVRPAFPWGSSPYISPVTQGLVISSKGSSQVADGGGGMGNGTGQSASVPGQSCLCCLWLPEFTAKAQEAWVGCTGKNKCLFPLGCSYPVFGKVLMSTTQCRNTNLSLPTSYKCGHNLALILPKHSQMQAADKGKKFSQ